MLTFALPQARDPAGQEPGPESHRLSRVGNKGRVHARRMPRGRRLQLQDHQHQGRAGRAWANQLVMTATILCLGPR